MFPGIVLGDEPAERSIRDNCNKIMRLSHGKMTALENF
jgi:hypothetical protein